MLGVETGVHALVKKLLHGGAGGIFAVAESKDCGAENVVEQRFGVPPARLLALVQEEPTRAGLQVGQDGRG